TPPRARVPFVPRPAVLPLEPCPRPTRVFAVRAPGAGRRWWTFSPRLATTGLPSESGWSGRSGWSAMSAGMSVDLLNAHQMVHRAHHAPDLRSIVLDHRVAASPQAKCPQGRAVAGQPADLRAHLGDLELTHHAPLPVPGAAAAGAAVSRLAARARSIAGGATSSSGSPRRAAISSGRYSDRSAVTVACTMLMGLEEP